MGREVVLRAEKINKSFPGVKVLSDVSFDLEKGEVHILLGENGAGKSTLMKIFSGLYSVDSGNIYVNGEKVTIRNTKKYKTILYSRQKPGNSTEFPVDDDVLFIYNNLFY